MSRAEQPQALTEGREAASRNEASVQSSMIGLANESPRFSPRPSNGLERSVELHIEELALDGFSRSDRYLIGEAVERELSRLFKEQGAPRAVTQDSAIAHLDGATFEMSAGSNSEAIGVRLAKTIYGGLGK